MSISIENATIYYSYSLVLDTLTKKNDNKLLSNVFSSYVPVKIKGLFSKAWFFFPAPQVHTDLLNISSNPSRYIKAAQHSTGATAADLLRSGMGDPSEFIKHKTKILELLSSVFKSNLVSIIQESFHWCLIWNSVTFFISWHFQNTIMFFNK